MKTWPMLLAPVIAGSSGAQVVEEGGVRSAAGPMLLAEVIAEPSVQGARSTGFGSSIRELVEGRFLAHRYEFAVTLSTRRHCLAIRAEGEARTIVDLMEVSWCPRDNEGAPQQPETREVALAKIQVSTQLLRRPEEPLRGSC
jgi:hypothetical protein